MVLSSVHTEEPVYPFYCSLYFHWVLEAVQLYAQALILLNELELFTSPF